MSQSPEHLLEALRKALRVAPNADGGHPAEVTGAVRSLAPAKLAPAKVAEQLREHLTRFQEVQKFKVGDVLEWKDGLRNKTVPDYGSVGIVVEVLDEPVVVTSESSGSPYFRESLDVLIGIMDSDGDFTVLHVDSRRFKLYQS